jgi:hypothetical protein
MQVVKALRAAHCSIQIVLIRIFDENVNNITDLYARSVPQEDVAIDFRSIRL